MLQGYPASPPSDDPAIILRNEPHSEEETATELPPSHLFPPDFKKQEFPNYNQPIFESAPGTV